MKLQKLNQLVWEQESHLAPGSETALLGVYNERMRQLTGCVGVCEQNADPDVPDSDAAWFLGAYAAELLAFEGEADGTGLWGTVGDWDSEAWTEDKSAFPEADWDARWPDYYTGFSERLAELRAAHCVDD